MYARSSFPSIPTASAPSTGKAQNEKDYSDVMARAKTFVASMREKIAESRAKGVPDSVIAMACTLAAAINSIPSEVICAHLLMERPEAPANGGIHTERITI